MKNNSMTNFAFVSALSTRNADNDTFNIRTQAAVLESDPYQFLDSLDQKITSSPIQAESRLRATLSLSRN